MTQPTGDPLIHLGRLNRRPNRLKSVVGPKAGQSCVENHSRGRPTRENCFG